MLSEGVTLSGPSLSLNVLLPILMYKFGFSDILSSLTLMKELKVAFFLGDMLFFFRDLSFIILFSQAHLHRSLLNIHDPKSDSREKHMINDIISSAKNRNIGTDWNITATVKSIFEISAFRLGDSII